MYKVQLYVALFLIIYTKVLFYFVVFVLFVVELKLKFFNKAPNSPNLENEKIQPNKNTTQQRAHQQSGIKKSSPLVLSNNSTKHKSRPVVIEQKKRTRSKNWISFIVFVLILTILIGLIFALVRILFLLTHKTSGSTQLSILTPSLSLPLSSTSRTTEIAVEIANPTAASSTYSTKTK